MNVNTNEFQTGSMTNLLYAHERGALPEVGMGATILRWTDRTAATVVEVVSAKTIRIQEDIAKRIDQNGMSECQRYEFERNPEAAVETYTLRSNGAWVRKGDSMRGGLRLALGKRDHYYDFSF